MNNRCAWGSKSTGRGVCDQPCEGRYCERHARAVAISDAGAVLRAAREAVTKARDEVVARAGAWYEAKHMIAAGTTASALEDAVAALYEAECVEAEARARLEELR